MGKVKKKNGGGRRARRRRAKIKAAQSGIISGGDASMILQNNDGTTTDASSLTGLAGLQSSDRQKREIAAMSLAHLFVAPDNTSSLSTKERNDLYKSRLNWMQESGMVRKLIPRLCDTSLIVRLHCCGALRNIALEGGRNACEAMVKDDVLTPVINCMKELVPSAADGKFNREGSAVLVQAITLLAILCDASEVAVKVFSRNSSAIRLLVTCLGPNAAQSFQGHELIAAAARLLHCITDDNVAVAEEVYALGAPTLALLLSLAKDGLEKKCEKNVPYSRAEELTWRLHIAGSLLNIATTKAIATSSVQELQNIVGEILPLLNHVISEDVTGTYEVAAEADFRAREEELLLAKAKKEKSKDMEKTVMPTMENDMKEKKFPLAEWNSLVLTQAVAIELLANLTASIDIESDSIESSVIALPTEAHIGALSRVFQICNESSVTIEKVRTSLHQSSASTMEKKETKKKQILASKQAKENIQLLRGLQQRTLGFIGNAFQTFPDASLDISSLWNTSWTLFEKEMQEFQITSSAASAFSAPIINGSPLACMLSNIWSLCRRNQDIFSISDSRLDILCKIVANQITPLSSCQEVRSNACGILSYFGRDEIRAHLIGRSLLVVITSDASLLVVAEALNAIFELFGKDDAWLANVYKTLCMQNGLIQVLPVLQRKFSEDGSRLSEMECERVDEALENLQAFINYKN
eukprot:g4960.t1